MKLKTSDQQEIDILKKHAFTCSCGKTHEMNIDEITIGVNALRRLPEIVRNNDLKDHVFVVTEQTIYDLYGKQLEQILSEAHFDITMHVFPGKSVLPDELALARLLVAVQPKTDWILAVGSGAVNDLARYFSYKTNIPYVSVPTAASVDGYTANSSLLLLDGLKQSCKATYPTIIINDIDILRKAPPILLAAGFGDLTAKITAGTDWELDHIMTGIHYCEFVEKTIMDAVDRAIAVADRLFQRDEAATQILLEGLTIAGMAMHWTGISQPLGGAEHHITHFWNMRAVAEGRTPHLHGIEVAQGIVLVMQVYHEFLKMDFSNLDVDALVRAQTDKEAWKKEIAQHYDERAGVIYAENSHMAFDAAEVRAEIERLLSNMERIKQCAHTHLKPYENIACALEDAGCIVAPKELGFTPEQIKESLCYAHYTRKKYTICRALSRLGCLEEIADKVVATVMP